MPRCCSGTSQVAIEGGAHIVIVGSGSPQNPFVIAGDTSLDVTDNVTFNLTLSGSGTSASPWLIDVNFATTAKLDHLPDVNAPTPTNGQVLGWDSTTSKWTARAPTTAATGSVTHDLSLLGDGSISNPLQVNESAEGYLSTKADGLSLSDPTINKVIRKYANASARTAASPAPTLNTISMLDTEPGREDYWTGSSWRPVNNGVNRSFSAELLAMSGSYPTDGTIEVMVRAIDDVTDASGNFNVLAPADLAGRAGVLFATFQETGSVAFKAMLNGAVDRIVGTAYSLTDGTPLVSQAVSGMVFAYVY